MQILSPKGFLYQSVTEILRSRIISGSYESGARIPSLEELATEFSVSHITIRRAVKDLVLEGHLVTRQGLGVFVASKRRIVRSLHVGEMVPIEVEMANHGIEASLKALNVTLVPTTDQLFLDKLAPSTALLHRSERMLFADREVVGLDTLWVPSKLARKLKSRIADQFVMSYLSEIGIQVERIKYQVEASTATEAQAAALKVIVGFPLLVIKFFPYDERGKLILVGRNVTRGDLFTYEFGFTKVNPT